MHYFKKRFLAWLCMGFYQPCLFSIIECIYPVAALGNDPTRVLLLHRQVDGQLKLWQWNAKTSEAQLVLAPFFDPADIKILPNYLGFSFMHEGLLRVKLFSRRSPRTIEFDKPLNTIGSIEWIDNQTFYFAARSEKTEKFGIYEATVEGETRVLAVDDVHNYSFPQKCGDRFFYVEHTPCAPRYYIRAANYPGPEEVAAQGQTIVEVASGHSVGFFAMISEKSGFFVSYITPVEKQSKRVACMCHLVRYEADRWQVISLFTFHVPTSVFSSADDWRVGISATQPISPFISYVACDDSWCYIDYDQSLNPSVFIFNLRTNEVAKKLCAATSKSVRAGVLCVQDHIFVGGSPNTEMFEREIRVLSPTMKEDIAGTVRIVLPCIDIKLSKSANIEL